LNNDQAITQKAKWHAQITANLFIQAKLNAMQPKHGSGALRPVNGSGYSTAPWGHAGHTYTVWIIVIM